MEQLAERVAQAADADVIFYAGPLEWPSDDDFIVQSFEWQRRTNVLLMPTTYGGSAHVSYRLARCLRRRYRNGKIIVFVDTDCLSAGTLLAIGSDELILSDLGQLSPLDVQRLKRGEVGERTSGLVASKALYVLEGMSQDYFWRSFRRLRFKHRLPTELAAEVAQGLTIGLFSDIYSQIEPMDLGENQRALDIGREYGERLGENNLKPEALSRLIAAYPAHGFVIDRDEASTLFIVVRPPTEDQRRLAEALRDRAQSALNRDKVDFQLLSKSNHDNGDTSIGETRVKQHTAGSAQDPARTSG